MAKDIDLSSKKWLDLIFEGRNKQYGAYELRESSSRRHLLAIGVVMITGLGLIFLPKLIHKGDPATIAVKQQTEVVITQIDNPVIPEKMPAHAVEVVASASTPTQKSIKFVDPKIVQDIDVKLEDLLATQIDITNSDAAIGTTTIDKGTPEGKHPDDVAPVTSPAPVLPPIVISPEVWPQFDGNLLKWLSGNIRYPADAVEQGIQGRVILRFVIGADGSVGKVDVLQPLFPSCDKEAVRVVSKMPKWIPGKQNNQVVSVYYTLPVYFKLQK
ncbi:cell envelope biogenesis protein TonB [Bacteroidia bacterium]|nr:cell envelope biogenesis protein TonB [Bacteroidia bacterium]